ncbi:MAG TPA: c-type cytochrome [Chloroflexota bacterium]|nr:c-type cytochrome [Chloroflexota bacterium]
MWSARLLAGFVLGLVLAALTALLLVSPAALVHRQTGAIEQLYGNLAVHLVARTNAGSSMPAPAAAGQDGASGRGQRSAKLLADAGRNAYLGSCAQCHGDKGDGKGALGRSTAPVATDLTSRDARDKTDAQLFWIIKNGLSFTAMPGFASDYPDEDVTALVTYVRGLQKGEAQPVVVPTPTAEQLQATNPAGDPAQRGAAVYFAQNCQRCHGPVGQAPEELAIADLSDLRESVRRGRPGMPTYGPDRINDDQLQDLLAYMRTFPSNEEE